MTDQRVALITFPKCGSQWVRDVLAARRMARYSGLTLETPERFEMRDRWHERSPGVLVGPVYNVARETWLKRSGAGDRAVVVLRDPRDQIVSWIFSLCYSHRLADSTDIFRELLNSLDDRGKLALMCEHWRTFYGAYRSFSGDAQSVTNNCLVTTYERLVCDGASAFGEIVSFLGWKVPPKTVERVVDAHSFRILSGREPGQQDPARHLRKGQPGDWENYFDRDLGRFFELRYDSLLTLLGYESDPAWFEKLPDRPRLSFSLS